MLAKKPSFACRKAVRKKGGDMRSRKEINCPGCGKVFCILDWTAVFCRCGAIFFLVGCEVAEAKTVQEALDKIFLSEA